MLCTSCKVDKENHQFHKGEKRCKPCRKIKAKKYYTENKQKVLERNAKWRESNRHVMSKLCIQHFRRNKEYYAARNAKRRAHQLDATPAWLNEESFRLVSSHYETATLLTEATGIPHEVDHIIPLQGYDVCGLHVPENLQVIPRQLNRGKGNKLVDSYL